jgi:hypothetical protein
MQQTAPQDMVALTSAHLKELSERVQTIDPLAAQRLAKLSEALGKPVEAAAWANGDVRQLIDIDTITERAKGQGSNRFINTLEWLRNVLIVVPLALTWFSISQAVSQYHTLITKDSQQATQPFILLWEQGFAGQHQWFDLTLSQLAFGDFILLSVIVVLTLIVSWQQNVLESNREKQAARLRSELADVLTRAAQCIGQYQLNSPTDFAGVVMRLDHVIQQIATRLDTVTQQISSMVQQFIKELEEERKQRGDLNTFLQGLDRISRSMLSAADTIQRSITTLNASLDALTTPVKEIPLQQKALIQHAQDILAQLVPVTSGLHQLITEQRTEWQNLQRFLVNSSQQLLAEQKQAHQEMLAEQHGFGKTLHDTLYKSLERLLMQQGQWSKELVDSISTLNSSQAQMVQLMQQIELATQQQAQLIQSIDDERQAQTVMTQNVRDVAKEMKDALTAVQLMTPELRSITVDMAKFLAALRAIPTDLKTELFDPLRHYSSAADNVSKGAERMADAASVMQRAGQELQIVASRLNGQQHGN